MKKENRIFKRNVCMSQIPLCFPKDVLLMVNVKIMQKMAFLMMYDLVLQIQNLKFIDKKFSLFLLPPLQIFPDSDFDDKKTCSAFNVQCENLKSKIFQKKSDVFKNCLYNESKIM